MSEDLSCTLNAKLNAPWLDIMEKFTRFHASLVLSIRTTLGVCWITSGDLAVVYADSNVSRSLDGSLLHCALAFKVVSGSLPDKVGGTPGVVEPLSPRRTSQWFRKIPLLEY